MAGPLQFRVTWFTAIPEHHFCVSFVSIAALKTMTKSNLGSKGFIWLTYPEWQSIKERLNKNSRQKLEQKPLRNIAFTRLFLVACSARFLRPPVTTCSWMELLTECWALPPQLLIKQMKWPTDLPTGQSEGWNFSIEVPSSQMVLVCVKLTNPPAHFVYHGKNICIIHVHHYSYSCSGDAETGCSWWICLKQQKCPSGSKHWKPTNQSLSGLISCEASLSIWQIAAFSGVLMLYIFLCAHFPGTSSCSHKDTSTTMQLFNPS